MSLGCNRLLLFNGVCHGLFWNLILPGLKQRLVSEVSTIRMILTVVDSGRLVMLLLLMENRDHFNLVSVRIMMLTEERNLMDCLVLALSAGDSLFVMDRSCGDRDLILGSSPVAWVVEVCVVSLMSVAIVETVVNLLVMVSGPEMSVSVVDKAILVLIRSLILDGGEDGVRSSEVAMMEVRTHVGDVPFRFLLLLLIISLLLVLIL